MLKHCVAIDIGGTSAKLGLVSQEGKILSRTSVSMPKGDSLDLIIELLTQSTNQLLKEAAEVDAPVEGIGIGHPGFYDNDGRLKDLCNIPALNGFPLAGYFQQRFQLPAKADTDVSCGTLGEFHFGNHRDISRFLFLTLGTGIGAGCVVNGQLMRTTRNCLGDPGHIIVDPAGRLCTCGGRGCLEAVASGWAISEQAKEMIASGRQTQLAPILKQKDDFTPEDVFSAAGHGDAVAQSLVDQTAHWLAMGLATYCVLFEPKRIALGGGIAAGAGEQLMQPVRERFFRVVSPAFARNVEIRSAQVGADAGLLGAATLIIG